MKLLLGGSPCTHWSIAQTRNRETQPEGLGWELFRNYLIARERYGPDFYLYENNKSMAPAIRAQITAELGVEPLLINSALVSAQSRQRLYWTNIPGVELPEDRGLILLDVLESGLPLHEKGYTLKANYSRASAVNALDGGHFPAPMAIEPVNVTADGKAQCLRATYYKDGIRNMVGNTIDRKTCVATPIRVCNINGGRQGNRIYSTDAKSCAIKSQGGGMGGHGQGLYAIPADKGVLLRNILERSVEAKTGRYTVPTACPALRVTEATAKGYTDILPGECVDLTMPNSKTRRGRAMREKANCLTTSCQYYQYCGTLDRPIYEVRDGQITIKGQQYPIKLMDGYYIIRKLTVRECMRLQTVPEDFVFPVSDTQAYKMLGNGWTVDVIAHILSYCPGIIVEPLEVLSMYDGMSCGHLALNKLGTTVLRYYATEIDKYAIKTTQTNFPGTIQLGDAFQVREDKWWSFFEQAKGV
ncbi:DNA cytosine methyltransferase [Anaerotruncus colihominis]|uniref:DNA cytosine methyltransferase n=1 Tax=Anaerotruncus colihominis TaxID=169435 RepID=UPI001FACFB02|nr:DNA cytosine methyltransferase [Anaerotruncus colihominis]MCR2027032.1 DNA cytosine methyltransferase [Anaerotruncus colihominis]